MLQVDREIEGEDRQGDGQPVRQVEIVQQAPAPLLTQNREADGRSRQQEAQQGGVQGDDAEVGRPARPTRKLPPATRRHRLPSGDDEEDTEEKGDADDGFARHLAPQSACATATVWRRR